MRCKNCGYDNEEGRYICANCGSPLYDENEEIVPEKEEQNAAEEAAAGADTDADAEKNKKSIVIIIVLAVILVALIAGIIVSAVTGKDKETTTESTTISTTAEETTKKQTTTKKETTTERETTTEEPTTTTTKPETTTAAPVIYNVYADIDGNGSVTGDGAYEKGKKATLTASADEGWQFDGWYDNSTGSLVASSSKYTVTVTKDINVTAKFTQTEALQ